MGGGNIVEIGGGFGRTCHSIMVMSDLEGIESYTIIDLEPMLQLSKAYLSQVLPVRSFSKIRFISTRDVEQKFNLAADLVINIDSMQEMPPNVIDFYMKNVIRSAKYFYCKNSVGKYKPENVGLNDIDEKKLQDVFELGRCRNIIDIFNKDDLRCATKRYLAAYNPDEEKWQLRDHREMTMFPYFVHAIYERKY